MKLRTHFLACREHIGNIGSKKVTITNKVIRDKSRCPECFSDKSGFMKQNHNKNVVGCIITNMLSYCLKCKEIQRI